ncbi:MAG: LuxR C-terminal-related transcriptional regulator [Spirosomataceae bacterium]
MPTQLTQRQLDVLRLISAQYSTAQIAETLHLSVNTVETHRKNLFKKLGAKNAVGLVKIAIEQHLLE